MAKGRATERIKCSRYEECGGHITVTFDWWDYPATWGYDGGTPPDAGAEAVHVEPCDECEHIPDEEYVDKAINNLEFDFDDRP